jgi:hypothetical protein
MAGVLARYRFLLDGGELSQRPKIIDIFLDF